MRAEASAVLACVRCEGPLDLTIADQAGDGHVMTGHLVCARCGAMFPLERGVPRLTEGALSGDVGQTIEAFGYQWNRATALFDARFSRAETFLDFIHPVQQEWFVDKVVLDGGCGSGRFTLLAAGFRARLVVGIDLSSAVEVAFERSRHLENVLIVQGDMLCLPLRSVFDYAFSIGVLHHTADPRGAFMHMVSKVVPGGGVSAWVYGAESNEWVVRVINPARRITTHLPRPLLLVLAHIAAVPLTIVVKSIYGPVSRRPRLAWLKRRLFYFEYLAFLAQFGYREHAFIVFDHAVPAIAEYVSRGTFADWFRQAGLEHTVITDRAGNSWRGFGLVPVSEASMRTSDTPAA